jgi:hypothetical protein
MEKTVHIAVVPGVGYSHLVPILHFSKQLVQLHPNFHATGRTTENANHILKNVKFLRFAGVLIFFLFFLRPS